MANIHQQVFNQADMNKYARLQHILQNSPSLEPIKNMDEIREHAKDTSAASVLLLTRNKDYTYFSLILGKIYYPGRFSGTEYKLEDIVAHKVSESFGQNVENLPIPVSNQRESKEKIEIMNKFLMHNQLYAIKDSDAEIVRLE